MTGLKQYFPFLARYRKQFIVGPIFKLMEAVFELIIPIVMASLIDKGVKTGAVGHILRMGGLMLLFAVVGLACAWVCQYSASIASQGFGTALRGHLFSHISRFSFAELDRFGPATLTTRITNDVNQLQLAVAMLIRLAIRAPFLCIGGLISAMLLDFKLSLVLLVTVPVFAVVLALIMTASIKLYQRVQRKLDRLVLITGENLSGVRVIRAFARVPGENERFNDANKDHAGATAAVGALSSLSTPATTLIMNAGILAILWFGGQRVQIGGMTQGETIAFVNYISQILLALIVVANLVVIFTKAIASAQRVSELLAVVPSVRDSARPAPDKSSGGAGLEFRNVSFTYQGGAEPSLRDISFRLGAGQTAGIIGLTGSGKSTLVNLIPRFYDATEGEVLVGGVNVKDLPQQKLRERVGMVPQQTTLFSGTVKSNLRMGCESADDESLHRAAKTAQALPFIESKPQGFDSPVERGGTNLSGGQRQRLAIARALVPSPDLLILDDSTSALDFATEAALRRALREDTAGMTVLIVSQRASSVRHADLILVLEDGRLAASGTHEELIETCQIYRDICNSQADAKEGVR